MIDVKIFNKTPKNIDLIWDKMQQFPQLFEDSEMGRKEKFVQKISDVNTVCLDLEGKCFIIITDIVLGKSASFNIARWDMISDFSDKCKIIIDMIIRLLDLQRLTAFIPEFNHRSIKFAGKMGAKQEGTIRNAFFYQGEWHNLLIYSLLKEEV